MYATKQSSKGAKLKTLQSYMIPAVLILVCPPWAAMTATQRLGMELTSFAVTSVIINFKNSLF